MEFTQEWVKCRSNCKTNAEETNYSKARDGKWKSVAEHS